MKNWHHHAGSAAQIAARAYQSQRTLAAAGPRWHGLPLCIDLQNDWWGLM
jgi:hypothetical protein